MSPWELTEQDGRWYGRGAADNKGQHSVNLAALRQVLHSRGGQLGFNVKLILEMAEEAGSPGLADFCAQYQDELKADLFIGSDGPRVAADNPTLFLGSRGSINFELTAHCREGAHHSGNCGGFVITSYSIHYTKLYDALHLDFGQSFFYQDSVISLIHERIPVTLTLGAIALAVATCVAIPLGILAAIKQDRNNFV